VSLGNQQAMNIWHHELQQNNQLFNKWLHFHKMFKWLHSATQIINLLPLGHSDYQKKSGEMQSTCVVQAKHTQSPKRREINHAITTIWKARPACQGSSYKHMPHRLQHAHMKFGRTATKPPRIAIKLAIRRNQHLKTPPDDAISVRKMLLTPPRST
jgi:hypothetical protein